MNPIPAKTAPTAAWLSVLMTLAFACAACGPQVISGRPPFIGISAMQLEGESLNADFRIANQNELAMNLSAVDITMTVDGIELASEQREVELSIAANSSEELKVREFPAAVSRNLLASLENGDIDSLSFDLRGNVRTLEDGVLRFEQKGHLYPVPGKPGFFRSAVTQAEELRRADKL